MLDVIKIRKTFNPGTVNEKTAVSNLSLHLEDGDFVTIVGSNGAGKSTMFNAIAGSFYVDEGHIVLNDKNITYVPEYKRSKIIGRLFQDPLKGTAPNMTIEENLALAYLRSSSSKAPFSRINKKDKELFKEQLSLLNMGLESLHVRVKKHCENGLAVAQYLQGHEKVAYVNYCDLPGDPYYELAKKYLPNGSCGVVSFGVKGGRAAAEKFMKYLRLGAIETHVADARTCCLHPASATHRQMNDQEMEACGVKPDLVRYSCGLEDAKDLIADLEQAFAQI